MENKLFIELDEIKTNKVIRLVDFLEKLAKLRSKLVRDINDYPHVLWIHEIPNEKECFTQFWDSNEDIDREIWIKVKRREEPPLPQPPEVCKEWINDRSLMNTKDIPELLSKIDVKLPNPDFRKDSDSDEYIYEERILDDFPHLNSIWEKYIEQHWISWTELYEEWKRLNSIYQKLFEIHQELARLGEEYELILMIGLLTWKTPTGQHVKRHIIVADAVIEFESGLQEFIIKEHFNGTNLRQELEMIDGEDLQLNLENNLKERIQEISDISDRNQFELAMKAFINELSPNGNYINNETLEPSNPSIYPTHPHIEFAPAVVVRKRSTKGLTDTLKAIKATIQKRFEIPSEFADIAEVKEIDEIGENARIHTCKLSEDAEIYFPKPSNREQSKIIEKVRNNNGVLVQGPPGTGKSHTIANLISHLLATGNKVLVTAKSDRALRVLNNLLPDQIKPLCISLLGTGKEEKDSLEGSVNSILRKKDEWQEDDSLRIISNLAKKLKKLKKEKYSTVNQIRTIREAEIHTHSICNGLYKGTASIIAKSIENDTRYFDWFVDKIRYNTTADINIHDLTKAYYLTKKITAEKRDELTQVIEVNVPDLSKIRNLFRKENETRSLLEKYETEISIDTVEQLRTKSVEGLDYYKNTLSNVLLSLNTILNKPGKWLITAIKQITTGTDGIWKDRLNQTSEIEKELSHLVDEASDFVVEPSDLDFKLLFNPMNQLYQHFINGGKLGWGPFRKQIVKDNLKYIKALKVNGKIINNANTCKTLVDYLRLNILINKFIEIWDTCEIVQHKAISLNYNEIKESKETLQSVFDYESLIQNSLKELSNFVITGTDWSDQNSIKTLIKSIEYTINEKEYKNVIQEINDITNVLQSFSLRINTHSIYQSMLDSINERNIEKVIQTINEFEELRKQKQELTWLDNYFHTLSKIIPIFVEEFKNTSQNSEWEKRIDNLQNAIYWSQAKSWLNDYINQNKLPFLEDKLKRIDETISENIEKIAAEKAWSFCLKIMKEEHQRHMSMWKIAMKRLGKGTGKHAAKRRREAQNHLNKCKYAIPSWIMPLHRIWDTVEPTPGYFDVIIVDEASQCGFEALPLFYLSKKIIIVGDDKQISPESGFVDENIITRLIQEFLYDFDFKELFYKQSSLFHHGQVRYGTRQIALREHFRCMPEIIGFCNDLCYSDTPLIPLRQFGQDRLLPLKHEYIKEGYREGKGARVFNQVEAENLVEVIGEKCNDEKYKDKTFGVISLQGEGQSLMIQNLLLEKIGPEKYEERKLLCGNPYSFQGDERDVIFLSMVAATNERIGVLNKESDFRRFNVAVSRAKDQIWLFHSVKHEHLSEFGLRKRLLSHFEECKIKEIAGTSVNELERFAFSEIRTIDNVPKPFESWFELDVALIVARRGYKIHPQFEFAGKRIDIAVFSGGAMLAIECFGDYWHGPEEYDSDMDRIRQLERCKWEFVIIRESVFYADREKALELLWRKLDERGIFPQSSESEIREPISSDEPKSDENKFVNTFQDNEKEEDSFNETPENTYEIINLIEIGDSIEYKDMEDGKNSVIKISKGPSDPNLGVANYTTPFGRALIGRSEGDSIEISLPMGSKNIEVIKVIKHS